ncbi:MAG: hypothetical protein SOZ59_03060 [Candidatus Limivivens sp.]|nr:hypothetical protein [Candidatus Limivivens sp.]
MSKFENRSAVWAMAGILLSGCVLFGGADAGATEEVQEITETTAVDSAGEAALDSTEAAELDPAEEVSRVTVIAEVFGDGEKPSAAALEYPVEMDSSTLEPEDFEVAGQTITGVFTNSEAAIPESSVPGSFVILKFACENSESPESMGGGQNRDAGGMELKNGAGADGGKSDGGEDRADAGNIGKDGGLGNGNNLEMDGGMENESGAGLSVMVVQKGEIAGTDGTIYAGNDTEVESSEWTELIVEDFQLLEYTDPDTGWTIPYSLYFPENYEESREYPLVFFVADAGANSDNPIGNLTQGNGATVWASPEEQAKHECIVLSPQYTNSLINSIGALTTDENVWSDGLTLVSNLLHFVIEKYSVDENRIYGTGQSQGCMTNIALSDKYPDLFAAQLLVAGQWNVEEMEAMKDKNLWIVVCEGDSKAYPGMNEATERWESLGSAVARSEMWDSTSTAEQFDELVEQMEAQGCRINYTVFEGGSHTYTWSVAYSIEGIRDWLFAQTKE